MCLAIPSKIVNIEKCVPNPRNPNTHPDRQIELLAKIIENQGWRNPIVISNRSGFIVKGHGRLMAAQKLGASKAPVDYQDYESEAAEWQDMIADNRIAEFAEMDEVKERDILDELAADGMDVELCGIEIDEIIKEEFADIKNEDPPQLAWVLIAIPTIKYGDIAQMVEEIGENKNAIVETVLNDGEVK